MKGRLANAPSRTQKQLLGFLNKRGLYGYGSQQEKLLSWLPGQDTCDLDKVRLTHLDGSPLTVDEYDRMQRFIRLWHKLGWTIVETDLALIGMSRPPAGVVRDDLHARAACSTASTIFT